MKEKMKPDCEFILNWSKKIKAINHLGGECRSCGILDVRIIEFHHENDDKEFTVSELKSYKWSKYLKEVEKCILLCRRCHAVHHGTGEIKDDRWRKTKEILLNYIGTNKCAECSWSGHQSGLDFHHVNSDEKEFSLSRIPRLYSTVDITKEIVNELIKCKVLCCNCHQIKHITNRFDILTDKIYDKVDKLK